MLAIEWIASVGIIVSILLYPKNVLGAASLALICNAALLYLFIMKSMWGIVLLCLAAAISHTYNIWRERDERSQSDS